MLLGMIVTLLSHLGMALLGAMFKTTAETAQSHGVDASSLQYMFDLVSSAEQNAALADGDAKYEWVFAEAVKYFAAHGMDLAMTFVESLIQLAVHHHHSTTGSIGQTVGAVITQMQNAPAPKSAKP